MLNFIIAILEKKPLKEKLSFLTFAIIQGCPDIETLTQVLSAIFPSQTAFHRHSPDAEFNLSITLFITLQKYIKYKIKRLDISNICFRRNDQTNYIHDL